MAEATSKLPRWRLRLLKFDYNAVLCVGVKHLAVHVVSCLKTGGGDTIALEDELPVIAIFDQVQTQNGSLKGDPYEKNLDYQWKATNEAFPNVPAGLALAEIDKEYPPKIQQLLEA